jgi:7-cyano-7-deazaguanine synthase in queuosine biosynthesis
VRIVCSQNPSVLDDSTGIAFAMYSAPSSGRIGRIGSSIPLEVRRSGLIVDSISWDFLSIALAVIAADQGCLRQGSADGWTRQIDLSVAVQSPQTWRRHAAAFEKALGFLTGDVWSLEFEDGGSTPPRSVKRKLQAQMRPSGDIVCLLSGGMDSLVGAIDLVEQGRQPVFVSQRAIGDSDRQRAFASRVGSGLAHLQLSHAARPPGAAERSQRARSLIFLAYGLLATAAVRATSSEDSIQVVVPENGFISMNVPLTDLRIGSLSTRTTHPYFLRQVQRIWNAVGLNVEIVNPYQFRTKGEVLASCRRQELLQTLASQSTSCGRFGRYGYKHCGRCVPCLVRRAAFLKWGQPDKTVYRFPSLKAQGRFDDVRSLAMACLRVQAEGVERWAAGAISFAELDDPKPYVETVGRGIDEARKLLSSAGVL